jgi:hypothetical protein
MSIFCDWATWYGAAWLSSKAQDPLHTMKSGLYYELSSFDKNMLFQSVCYDTVSHVIKLTLYNSRQHLW